MIERLAADVVVVGAGPAGIAAACRAAEAGAETLLLDENPRAGGQIWRPGLAAAPRGARRWLARLGRSGVRIESDVTVFDLAGERTLSAERDGQGIEISWTRLVVATGARELFLPFPGWTLPGVLGIGGAQAMVKSGASVAGKRIVIAGSGPLILPVAATLARQGARLEVVAEQAATANLRRFALSLWRSPSKLGQALVLRSRFYATRFRAGTWVAHAEGEERVRQVTLTDGRRSWNIRCDLLAASYGLVPNLELAHLLGCDINPEAVLTDPTQRSSIPGIFCAGEVCGIGGVDVALAEGEIAGLSAASRSVNAALSRRRDAGRRFAARLRQAFAPRAELLDRMDAETLICRCEDVAWESIDPTWSMRQAKLYRRVGMGPCQGRICGPALEHLCGWEPDKVRPPLKPVTARVLAARNTKP